MQGKRLISRILLLADGSEGCISAAKYGIALAKITGAVLKAIYVVNVDLLEQLERARVFVKVEMLDYERDLEEDGRDYLWEISELAASKGLQIETELLKGTVYKIVTQKAEEWGADLLIVGEHEPGASKQDVLYNEISLICRKARCTVLIAKNPEQIDSIFDTIT